jgi:hypothetical protein
MKFASCAISFPVAVALLFPLSGCDDPVPSPSFRLIAEDVTPDRGCTSVGDKIELYFPTTTDTLRGPAPAFPGYRCSHWDHFGSFWMLGCDARDDSYSLAENVTIEMYDGLEDGDLFLNYFDTPGCEDALQVIFFENL